MKTYIRRCCRKYLGGRFFPLLLPGLLLLAAGCGTAVSSLAVNQDSRPAGPEVKQMADKTTQEPAAGDLKFSLSVADAQWSRENPPQVTVRVENLSGGRLEAKGATTLSLTKLNPKDEFEKERETYLAFVNLAGETPATRIMFDYDFEPGYAEEVKLSPAALKWARAISAGGGGRDLSAAVPPGDYELGFMFALRTGTVKLPDSAKELRGGQAYTANNVVVHIR